MLTANELNRLQNFGYTKHGAAIVDAIWFCWLSQFGGHQIGMILICNPAGIYKAYIGSIVQSLGEAEEAKHIAEFGAKLPYAIAKAAFPTRPFDNLNYDVSEVQVRDA
jgi:hypothetical protein